ncbi:MAG TPA: beta-galactosidase [bacterium]|nr:beta-galactosidase [bacterium]
MPKVRIHKNEVWVGKKSVSLISGEIHYWRLNPGCWKEALARAREMGLQVIATYVPWDYHEYSRGKFDFTGKTGPTRDLKAFLELARKEKFWVIIRPGPYIYSEWPNEGVPAYAYRYHRLHPQFQEYARKYLSEVMKIIRPFQASRAGGHILMLQADNEIDPWPDVFGQQYGLGGKPGLFQDFMKSLYTGDLEDLNQSWGTDYQSFKEVGPFIATMLSGETGLPLKGDHELRRNIDYLKFKYFYSNRCAQWNVQTYRKLGVEIPIYLNLYPFFYAHDWVEMQKNADMVGIDLYPFSEFSEDRFEQRKFIDKIRYLKSISKIPYIAEFAAGVWHARHYETGVLTPNHYRLITLSALLGGVAGWNWYMLVNRDNWYMSPINEWGRVRGELFEVFKQLVAVFREMHPPSLSKMTGIAVTFNPIQYAARTLQPTPPVLTALYESDLDYEFWDPRSGASGKKYLFYSGNQWLEAAAQKNIRSFVEEGGTLIAFRDYPRKNELFQASPIIGFENPERVLFEFKKNFTIQLSPERPKIQIVSSVYHFEARGARKITADFGAYGKLTVGYIKKIGRGRILHLGMEPTRELILEIAAFLKIPLAAHSVTRDVKTAFFKRGSRFYLVAVNNGEEEKSASIFLPALGRSAGPMKVRDILEKKERTCSRERRHPFTFEIGRKDGKVFEFRPA